MTLTIYTARVTYAGPFRLDITRKGNDPIGVAFAPSWGILAPVIEARRDIARDFTYEVDRSEALRHAEAAWLAYVPQYTAEMRVSAGAPSRLFGPLERAASTRGVLPRRAAWLDVIERQQVVLVCFCTDAERCHRQLLAGFLVKFAIANGKQAEDGGELGHRVLCACGRVLHLTAAGAVCNTCDG